MYSVTHDFSAAHRILVYNFGMQTVFYVQITNNAQPCQLDAEKVIEEGIQASIDGKLIFKNAKDEVVGSFRSQAVVGWWKKLE